MKPRAGFIAVAEVAAEVAATSAAKAPDGLQGSARGTVISASCSCTCRHTHVRTCEPADRMVACAQATLLLKSLSVQ
jgi:hypothetical protein